jgi:protein-L-isoaspartate O-methyltransferase
MPLQTERSAIIAGYNAEFYTNAQASNVACLCGSARVKKLYDKDRYGLKSPTVICRDCGLVFTSPRPSESFMRDFYESDAYRFFYEEATGEPELRSRYEGHYKDANFIHATSIKYLRATTRKPRVLEIGAGGGWNLVPFLRSCEVAGIEFSPMLCEMGRERGIDLRRGGLEQLTQYTSDFDLIIANHVVEHFFEFFVAMRAMLAKLDRDGILYLGVPDIDHYNESQIQNAHNYYFSQPTLVHYCRVLGLKPCEGGRDDSGIHQYAVFKLASNGDRRPNRNALSSEYKRIIKKHRRYHLKAKAASALDALGLKQAVRKALSRLP